MAQFDRENCPLLERCRQESTGSISGIFMIVALLAVIGVFNQLTVLVTKGFGESLKSLVTMLPTLLLFGGVAACFYFSNQKKQKEMEAYLEKMSDAEYESLVNEIVLTPFSNYRPIYLLGSYLFAPCDSVLANYKEITDVNITLARGRYGRVTGYNIIVSFRGVTRTIHASMNSDFDPDLFSKELIRTLDQAGNSYAPVRMSY